MTPRAFAAPLVAVLAVVGGGGGSAVKHVGPENTALAPANPIAVGRWCKAWGPPRKRQRDRAMSLLREAIVI